MSDYAFLPVNLDAQAQKQGRELRLVRVDAEMRPTLLRYSWRWYKTTGSVFRHNVDMAASVAAGGRVVVSQPLQYVVLPVDKLTPIHFHNGDLLDFRRANLLPVFGSADQAGCLVMGTSFWHKPEQLDALRELYENIQYYRAEAKSSRSLFSIAVTRDILEYVRLRHAGQCNDAVRAAVSVRFNDRKEVGQALLRQLLAGRTNFVPGYDYAALKSTRPGPGRLKITP